MRYIASSAMTLCRKYMYGILMYAGGFLLIYIFAISGVYLFGHPLLRWGRFGFGVILSILPVSIINGIISTWGNEHTPDMYFAAFLNTYLFVWTLVGTNAFYY